MPWTLNDDKTAVHSIHAGLPADNLNQSSHLHPIEGHIIIYRASN